MASAPPGDNLIYTNDRWIRVNPKFPVDQQIWCEADQKWTAEIRKCPLSADVFFHVDGKRTLLVSAEGEIITDYVDKRSLAVRRPNRRFCVGTFVEPNGTAMRFFNQGIYSWLPQEFTKLSKLDPWQKEMPKDSDSPNSHLFWDRIHQRFPGAKVQNPFGSELISYESGRWVLAQPDSGEIILEYSREANDWLKPTQEGKIKIPVGLEIVSFDLYRWVYRNSSTGVEMSLDSFLNEWKEERKADRSEGTRGNPAEADPKSTLECNAKPIAWWVRLKLFCLQCVAETFGTAESTESRSEEKSAGQPLISSTGNVESTPEGPDDSVFYDKIDVRWPGVKIQNPFGPELICMVGGRWLHILNGTALREFNRSTRVWQKLEPIEIGADQSDPAELVSLDLTRRRWIYANLASRVKFEFDEESDLWREFES